MPATEYVVLVDKNDQPIGLAEKFSAHQQNLLHRAFSVFIFRSQGKKMELLIQQRAMHKYHSPGLWTNTCCSHPRANEAVIEAGERRLYQELGIKAKLKNLGWFHYNAHFENGLSENEVDHVLFGTVPSDIPISLNVEEVYDCRWITVPALQKEISANPAQFTPWLNGALDIVMGAAIFNKSRGILHPEPAPL